MQEQHRNTAVLIFIRTALDEVRSKKGYSNAGYQNDLKLAGLLNRQVKEIAQTSGLPSFLISSKNQIGKNFAERFTNAIQQVFQYGYENVIAIGNDCLNLSAGHLKKANSLLSQHKFIIGPAQDGGAYLLGINKAVFDADQFIEMPWQHSDLLQALQSYSEQQQSKCILLQEERDLDSAFDLKEILKHLSFTDLVIQLLFIIGYYADKNIAYFFSILISRQQCLLFQRGPPLAF